MNYHKGTAAVTALIIAFGIIILGGIGYVVMNPEPTEAPVEETVKEDGGVEVVPSDQPEANHDAEEGTGKSSITWRFVSAVEVEGVPYTTVVAVVNGTAYQMGKFMGSCSEIGASGGIDGKGLLAGELSAVQCWFAGGGNEIGVFAHEDGGFDIMVGELSEGEEGAGMFRGDFEVKNTIEL